MSYRITLSRCAAGHRTYPARPDCPACGRDMVLQEEESHGTIITWTRIERPPEGFDTPQTVVVVRLDGDGEDEMAPPLVLARYDGGAPGLGQSVRISNGGGRITAIPVVQT